MVSFVPGARRVGSLTPGRYSRYATSCVKRELKSSAAIWGDRCVCVRVCTRVCVCEGEGSGASLRAGTPCLPCRASRGERRCVSVCVCVFAHHPTTTTKDKTESLLANRRSQTVRGVAHTGRAQPLATGSLGSKRTAFDSHTNNTRKRQVCVKKSAGDLPSF